MRIFVKCLICSILSENLKFERKETLRVNSHQTSFAKLNYVEILNKYIECT